MMWFGVVFGSCLLVIEVFAAVLERGLLNTLAGLEQSVLARVAAYKAVGWEKTL